MTRLVSKTALVSGAAKGIGAATARRLAIEGAKVLLTDYDEKGLEAQRKALAEEGLTVLSKAHDVADETAWLHVIDYARQAWGRLDILVNNAGISMFGLVTELTAADWRRCMAIDLDSVFFGTKAALPLMRESGGGSIINISSMAGIAGQANLSAYCAAKGGVRMFTKAVALECAAARDGVRVNSVHPGIIDTPIFHSVSSDAAVRAGTFGTTETIDVAALAAAVTPLGIPGQPDDVAAAVLYLASDDSRFVTGTELVVDGGFCAA